MNRLTWKQVKADSFVVLYTSDSYIEDYVIYVSRDQKVNYIVGRRLDDYNDNTQGTSFSFMVPKNWYFMSTAEWAAVYYIYPLKGVKI